MTLEKRVNHLEMVTNELKNALRLHVEKSVKEANEQPQFEVEIGEIGDIVDVEQGGTLEKTSEYLAKTDYEGLSGVD